MSLPRIFPPVQKVKLVLQFYLFHAEKCYFPSGFYQEQSSSVATKSFSHAKLALYCAPRGSKVFATLTFTKSTSTMTKRRASTVGWCGAASLVLLRQCSSLSIHVFSPLPTAQHARRIHRLWTKSGDDEDYEDEKAAIAEVGGDPSFLAGGADFGDGELTSENEAREAEIAAILENGGDPSFLMDIIPAAITPDKLQGDEEEAAALEEAGGDPFFLPDVSGSIDENESKPDFPQPKLQEGKAEEDQDWFRIGRQMAMDLKGPGEIDDKEEVKKEAPKTEKEPVAVPTSSASPVEEAQAAALEAAQSLVEATEAAIYAKQKHLSAVQTDIQKVQEQLKVLLEQEASLQDEFEDAVSDQVKSIEKQQAVRQAFALLTGDQGILEDVTPETKSDDNIPPKVELPLPSEGPRYSGTEGESFDSIQDEIEAFGGDPFFLADGDTEEHDKKETGGATTTTFKRKSLKKNPLTNEVEEEENYTDEESLLEVGGDPNFLDSYDERADESKAYDRELLREEIEEAGGDASFLFD